MGHFQLPLNLPHAGKIAWRISQVLDSRGWTQREDGAGLMKVSQELQKLLTPFYEDGENPPDAEGEVIKESAAKLGREFVDEIEKVGAQDDRLGQCVRNLFECLELGKEGAEISLRAGENPKSAQRP